MSLLLSRRYSVFGKLLKRRHKSVVDGDRRSGNIFESSRGQFADVYSCENNGNERKIQSRRHECEIVSNWDSSVFANTIERLSFY